MTTRAFARLSPTRESRFEYPDSRVHLVQCPDCGSPFGNVVATEFSGGTPRYWYRPAAGWSRHQGVWRWQLGSAKPGRNGPRKYRLPAKAICSRCELHQTLDARRLALPPWTEADRARIAAKQDSTARTWRTLKRDHYRREAASRTRES